MSKTLQQTTAPVDLYTFIYILLDLYIYLSIYMYLHIYTGKTLQQTTTAPVLLPPHDEGQSEASEASEKDFDSTDLRYVDADQREEEKDEGGKGREERENGEGGEKVEVGRGSGREIVPLNPGIATHFFAS